MSPLVFDQEVAVITGAAEGIGLGIAMELALQGARIILNDLDGKKLKTAIRMFEEKSLECIPISGDAGDMECIKLMVQTAMDSYGRLDMAVANAGITAYGGFFEFSPEDFQKLIRLNLQGSFFLAQAAAKVMKLSPSGGRILLMSSVTGHQAHEYLVAYGMSKAALQMLAKALVLELSPHQISINAISPGATLTRRTIEDNPGFEEVWTKITPMGRAATVQDIVGAALFLLSPHSKHITGQTLIVDGGWTATSPSPNLGLPK